MADSAFGSSLGSTLNGVTDLLGSLFGTGSKTIDGSGTSNSQTASISNTAQQSASASGEVESTSSNTSGSTTGNQTNTGTSNQNSSGTSNQNSSGTSNQNTNTSGTSTTTGGSTGVTNTSSTTIGTADAGALQTARDITSKALAAMTDTGAINDLISSTLNKASVAFAPTRNQQRGAGLYNGATGQLLTGYAEGQATSDAVASVLQYQQNEQQIAMSANASILEATKGSTTSGSSTNAGTNTSNTSSDSSGTTTGSSTGSTSGSQTGTQTGNTAGTQNNSGTSQSSTDSVTARILQSLQSIVGSSNSNVDNNTTQQSTQQQSSSGVLSVICTEMKIQGKLDHRLYEIGTRHFIKTYSADAMKAYWMWAKPVVAYMQEHPSDWKSKLVSAVFLARAKHVGWKYKVVEYSLTNHIAYGSVAGLCISVGLVLILMPRYWNWLTSVSEEVQY